MPRPDGRSALLDAAERLFAEQGILLVSDRKIAEAAGNSNHSAVGYYFGGRTGLLEAMLRRHLEGLEPARKRLFAESDSLDGDVRALVLPVTSAFAELPLPSWRARFLSQAYYDPTAVQLLRGSGDSAPAARAIFASIVDRLAHLDPAVVAGRAALMTHVVSSACAEVERRVEASGDVTEWDAAGAFLCDALVGMVQAPITAQTAQTTTA